MASSKLGRWLVTALALGASGCAPGRTVYVVDSLEEGRAILVDEEGEVFGVALSQLPADAREGDVISDGRVDLAERERLQDEIRERRERLRTRGPGDADLSLEGP